MQGGLYALAKRNVKALAVIALVTAALIALRHESLNLTVITKDVTVKFEAR